MKSYKVDDGVIFSFPSRYLVDFSSRVPGIYTCPYLGPGPRIAQRHRENIGSSTVSRTQNSAILSTIRSGSCLRIGKPQIMAGGAITVLNSVVTSSLVSSFLSASSYRGNLITPINLVRTLAFTALFKNTRRHQTFNNRNRSFSCESSAATDISSTSSTSLSNNGYLIISFCILIEQHVSFSTYIVHIQFFNYYECVLVWVAMKMVITVFKIIVRAERRDFLRNGWVTWGIVQWPGTFLSLVTSQ